MTELEKTSRIKKEFKFDEKITNRIANFPVKRAEEIKEVFMKRVKDGMKSYIVELPNGVNEIHSILGKDNLKLSKISDHYYKVQIGKS